MSVDVYLPFKEMEADENDGAEESESDSSESFDEEQVSYQTLKRLTMCCDCDVA